GVGIAVVAQSEFIESKPRVILSDAGVLVIYEVSDRATGSLDIAAVKLDGLGKPIWPTGVWIASSRRRERIADVVRDGKGGAIVIIEAISGPDTAQSIDVIAAHVDAYGKVGWGASPDPAVIATSRHFERNPVAVADGLGGAFIAYEIEYASGPRKGDRDILAQHLTAQGQREWVSETALPMVSSVATASESKPVIVSDSDGIIIAFEMNFHSEKRPVHIIGVQRVDATGRLAWNKGKKPETIIVPNRIVEKPRLSSDGAGGIFLVAEARDSVTGDVDLFAQKFTSAGEQLWKNGELPVAVFQTSTNERSPSARPDGSGGLIVTAVKDFVGVDNVTRRKIVAQRIGPDGRNAWPQLGGPLLLSNSTTIDDTPTVIKVE
ncbi:MAG: hypothetical protein H7X80_05265, partial [bacterium]|nr:hypothetical protein [Candidatus Kapabacteria bacterium]